jgi:S-adenosylmethionine synthetase
MQSLIGSGTKTFFLLFHIFTVRYFQISYAIGVAKPLSVTIFSYGTSPLSERELLEVVESNFDLRPGMIMR